MMTALIRLMVLALGSELVFAQSVPLWPAASIEIHPAPVEKANHMAVILTTSNADAMAEWLNQAGFCVFVVVRPKGSDVNALEDTQRAIRMARWRADEWNVDRRRIGVMGFEFGQPAALAAIRFESDGGYGAGMIDQMSDRPDFAVLDSDGRSAVASAKSARNVPPAFLAEDGDGQPADSWHTRFVDWITELATRDCWGILAESNHAECLCH